MNCIAANSKMLKNTGSLDAFRLISAFLVVAIHTSPLTSISTTADFILTRIAARIAVPFFFMVTGYFLYHRMVKGDTGYIKAFIRKICLIYGVSILLYLPLNLYKGYLSGPLLWMRIIKDIVFEGTFYHLWYLPASAFGLFFVHTIMRKTDIYSAFGIFAVFYVVGLFGDSYYGVAETLPALKAFYDILFRISDYTRNGLFFAPVYIVLGAWVYQEKKREDKQKCLVGLIISTGLLLAEGMILHILDLQRHDSMYIMLLPTMYFLYHLLLQTGGKSSKRIRSLSLLIYILHPWVIVVVRVLAKITQMQKLLIDNSILHFTAVSILTFAAAWILILLWNSIERPVPAKENRAWVEINLDALRHNTGELQKLLPSKCKLMAVVKANAYGHGDTVIARALNKYGIQDFAVATLEEGIRLRKHGIKGEILILGYTQPDDASCLVRYRLTQAVPDQAYAKALNEYGRKIKVNIKLDTGMHRLGVDADNLPGIEEIFRCRNLMVEGIFSHLCVSDNLEKEDISYTNMQIGRFFHAVKALQGKGWQTGKLHIQASYGILNYPELPCDLARAGIALYGAMSDNRKTHADIDLQPVLSLKARVSSVREISSGECVGYGRHYTSSKVMKIASVTVGYSDGIPRNLSDHGGYVLLHSQRAPIIGRVCMDQMIIDVSDIGSAKPNDVATIIGKEGREQILCEDIAEKCGTITNEILSRLGGRLKSKVIQECQQNQIDHSMYQFSSDVNANG